MLDECKDTKCILRLQISTYKNNAKNEDFSIQDYKNLILHSLTAICHICRDPSGGRFGGPLGEVCSQTSPPPAPINKGKGEVVRFFRECVKKSAPSQPPQGATGGFREATECGCAPTKGSESPFATEGKGVRSEAVYFFT